MSHRVVGFEVAAGRKPFQERRHRPRRAQEPRWKWPHVPTEPAERRSRGRLAVASDKGTGHFEPASHRPRPSLPI